ncbi:hypothetical protein HanRHA438_Chr01g0034731 [Helianthus annuus]|nr:hypothetical protein HanRHA438_Chr01g0034731 [Helianthus annuus]
MPHILLLKPGITSTIKYTFFSQPHLLLKKHHNTHILLFLLVRPFFMVLTCLMYIKGLFDFNNPMFHMLADNNPNFKNSQQ